MILEREIDMVDKREYSESVVCWKAFLCQWVSEAINKKHFSSIYVSICIKMNVPLFIL
jgi:hypothetical protein